MAFLSNTRLQKLFLLSSDPIRKAIQCIDQGERGIALVVDSIEEHKLIATITDGDIRRAIVAGHSLDQPVERLLEIRSTFHPTVPIAAGRNTSTQELVSIMRNASVRQIPIVTDAGVVLDLVTLDDLQPREDLPLQAVIMAGGEGIRLRPLTDELPKPMLPVGDQPLLELIVGQLRNSGIKDLSIALRYKKEKIIEYFDDGNSFGVDIKYFTENEPLGTAGALGLMDAMDKPMLVINGDILTRIDFRGMFEHHQKNHAAITVGVRTVDFMVPFGIVECDGVLIKGLQEKPTHSYLVNAGIYILDPRIMSFIPKGRHLDMTELIQDLLNHNEKVIQYPIVEYWMDIGQHADYQKVQDDIKTRKEGNPE